MLVSLTIHGIYIISIFIFFMEFMTKGKKNPDERLNLFNIFDI